MNLLKFKKSIILGLMMIITVGSTTVTKAQENNDWSNSSIKDTVKITIPRAQVYVFNTTKQSMVPVAGKKFDKNSLWYTNSYKLKSNSDGFYRISKNEYLKSSDSVLSGINNSGILKPTKNIKQYIKNGIQFTQGTAGLKNNVQYPYTAYTVVNGMTWYKVSGNGWVKKAEVIVNPKPAQPKYQNPQGWYQYQTTQIKPRGKVGYWLYNGTEGIKVWQVRRYFGLSNVHTIYDWNVISRVRNFQATHGLKVTGVVDYNTWVKMGLLPKDFNAIDSYVAPLRTNVNSTRKDHVEAFINEAYKYLGKPWISGAASSPYFGVDCSGLVTQAMYATGIDTPSYSAIQHAQKGNEWNSRLMYADSHIKTVPYSQRQRGDLIFYRSPYDGLIWHVAIYLGNNQVIDSWPPRVAINNINNPQYSSIARVGRIFH